MFVVTLLSAVSATTNPDWGTLAPGNCKNVADSPEETKKCLDAVGGRGMLGRWSSGTCEELLPKTSKDEDNAYCLSTSKNSLEAPTCCGSSCPSAKCTQVGNVSEKKVAEFESTSCTDAADDTTCSDLSSEYQTLTKRPLVLECKNGFCAPKPGQVAAPETVGTPEKVTGQQGNGLQSGGPGDDKGPNNNAFTMGLSLAGALIILQL